MNTDIRQQIQAALRAFSGSDLRAASIGLLNTLGYQSEKTLDLDNTPDAFLAEFDKRDRKFRKEKALLERWKSVEFLFQITDDEVRRAGGQGTLFDSGYDHGNYQSYLFFASILRKTITRAPSSQTSHGRLICCSICPPCCSYGTMAP